MARWKGEGRSDCCAELVDDAAPRDLVSVQREPTSILGLLTDDVARSADQLIRVASSSDLPISRFLDVGRAALPFLAKEQRDKFVTELLGGRWRSGCRRHACAVTVGRDGLLAFRGYTLDRRRVIGDRDTGTSSIFRKSLGASAHRQTANPIRIRRRSGNCPNAHELATNAAKYGALSSPTAKSA